MNHKNRFIISILVIIGVTLIAFAFYFFRRYHSALNFESLKRHLEEINVEKTIQQESKKETPKAETIKVPILVYHSIKPFYPLELKFKKQFNVTPDVFEKELRYLKDNSYTVISFDALVNNLLENTSLPQKPVVLTFDDGWENQYTSAFPLLIKYNAPATFFIYTDAIGQKNFLTWQQVKNLDAAGMTIGSHTKSHPYLIKIINKQKLTEEIADSKKIIEKQLGKEIDFFAYPFGHYNNQIIDAVKEAGYKAARSFYKGVYNTKDNLFTLKVISASNDFDKFIKDLSE